MPTLRALATALLVWGAASLPYSLTHTLASVWQFPVGLPSPTPCDASLSFDLGCNSFWLREDDWAVYIAQQGTMWPLVRYSLGSQEGATVLLYFPLFLADPLHGGVALRRLDAAIADAARAGLAVALFVGRPDYFGAGNASQSWNPVLSAPARAYVLTQLAALVTPARAATLSFLSLYWMGLACHAQGEVCSEAAVHEYTLATRSAVLGLPFVQHLDGMFWDACWPQPCPTWSYGGYSPTSLNNTADGLLGESWAMGSLVGAVNKLYELSVVSNTSLLLLDDTPNCDSHPTKPCSTGSVGGDVAAWSALLPRMGLAGTWGVWAAIDGGTAVDQNFYGDLLSSGTGLTAKGVLHRTRALEGDRNASGAAKPL